MEPELTREEAQSIYDQARFLFNQGAAIGDAWSRAMAADHITLEFAPASIRRALALEAGEGKVSLADMYANALKSREELQAYGQRLENDYEEMTRQRDAANARAHRLEGQYASEVARCVDAENQNAALRMKLSAVIAAAKGEQ
jgi:hypothetical protein